MPGRQRRTRALAILVCIAIVFFLYERNASTANQYAEYVREKAIGGGAVLRETEDSPNGRVGAHLTSSATPRPTEDVHDIAKPYGEATSAIPQVTARPGPIQDKAASRPADKGAFDHLQSPHNPDKVQLPIEVGEGRNVISINRPTTKPPIHWTKPAEQFTLSSTIKLPTGSPKPIPLIQYGGKGKADTERLAAVKEATQHAWKGYTGVALGYDELKPVSGEAKNTFNGWGATLVDSLDTLWIMGMTKEFEEALEQVRKIDFTTSSRPDIPLFEVTIRYLGGLLAAYDVSDGKYRILLDKAVELAEILYGAFDTPNRMPVTYYQWKPGFTSQPHRASSRAVLAELGTLNLEFTRLAQITGEPKYYDAIARVTDAFEEWQNRTRLPGMWPTWVDASGCLQKTERPAGMQSFQKQQMPKANSYNAASGPPTFYTGGDPAGARQAINDLTPSELHELADKSSFADDVRDLSEPATLKKKRQLSFNNETPARRPSFNFDPPNQKKATEEYSTGEEVCLHAGLNSTSYVGSETFTLGGMSDSVYEYLPKQYLMLGGRLSQYKSMYLASAATVIEKLLFRPNTPENRDLLFTGDMLVSVNSTSGEFIEIRKYKSEHLSCFVGGMFAMGGKIFEKPEHVEIGRRLADGCVWAYNSTASGIMPETFILSACPDLDKCVWNQTQYYDELDVMAEARREHPDTFRKKVPKTGSGGAKSKVSLKDSSKPSRPGSAENFRKGPSPRETFPNGDGNLLKRQLGEASLDVPKPAGVGGVPNSQGYYGPARHQHEGGRPYAPSKTVSSHTGDDDDTDYEWVQETQEQYVKERVMSERLPPGFRELTSRAYILRPEAIESVFYMYRITGEQHWRDAGWQMFQAVENATRVEFGHSAIHDVTQNEPFATNQMESFWIAETLKYFYLLFDDPAKWSLDDWVLNTEAHFFRRPESPKASLS